MKQNTYPVRSQSIQQFFLDAPSLNKILIVPIDYAKETHTAQFCNGNGEFLLRKALDVYNTPKGADYLLKRISGTMKRYHIKKEQVILVSEEPPSYMVNFIHNSRLNQFMWARVNANEAKKLRDNMRASSDVIDLTGIANALISRKATEVRDLDLIYSNLKSAARARRKMVIMETAAKNRIHQTVDVLFPGFLCEKKSGLQPFTDASLWFMENGLSPLKIQRMKLDTITKNLKRFRIKDPQKKAAELKVYSTTVLLPPEEVIAYNQKSLKTKVSLLKEIQRSIVDEENEMARNLVQTPAFYLTSIPGQGVVLAGHITAELGDPAKWLPTANILSYGGVIPKHKQSGAQAIQTGKLPTKCNKILKDYLMQSGYQVGTKPLSILKLFTDETSHTLNEYFQQVESRGGCSRLATAHKYIKIARRLIKDERVYWPKEWMDPNNTDSTIDNLAYHKAMLKKIKQKWAQYDLSGIPDECNYLKREENAIAELAQFSHKLQDTLPDLD